MKTTFDIIKAVVKAAEHSEMRTGASASPMDLALYAIEAIVPGVDREQALACADAITRLLSDEPDRATSNAIEEAVSEALDEAAGETLMDPDETSTPSSDPSA